MKSSVAILGYGALGKFLADKILNDPAFNQRFKLSFIWNRTKDRLEDVEDQYLLENNDLKSGFAHLAQKGLAPDLVVETSHPKVIEEYGEMLLQHSALMITSLTSLGDSNTHDKIIKASLSNPVYIPTGAAWGVEDIKKLDESGNLKHLKVTMSFTADALRLNEPLASKVEEYKNDRANQEPILLFKGNVKELARMAPNNVNTMSCIALAAPSIGFEGVIGNLLAHKRPEAHLIEIECYGKNGFYSITKRYNPAGSGSVTGSQTFHSFLSSLVGAKNKNQGMHFC